MLGFVVRRLRGRLPLAAAVLLTVLITTTVLTALFAFTRGVGEAGLRQALQGQGRTRTTVLLTTEHPVSARPRDDEAVRAFAGALFARLPAGVESVARSRPYGLPGAAARGKEVDLTLLASFGREHVRILAGQWPQAAERPAGGSDGTGGTGTADGTGAAGSAGSASGAGGARSAGGAGGAGPAPLAVAVPRGALARLGLTEGALPAQVRLDDRYGGPPLTVRVTGVYQAADPASAYWRLDPLGGREIQVASFTAYGPLLVDDTAFTAGGLAQDSRAALLTPDFATVRPAETGALGDRAAGLTGGGATGGVTAPAGFQVKTELPALLAELESGQVVARSSLLVGALQLAVLAAAALLLVAQLLTDRQEPERVLLTARGASRGRLVALDAAGSLLLALPAAVLAPLLTAPLLDVLGGFGPLARVPLDTSGTWLLWPVSAACALGCVLLTALAAALRGAGAAALRRSGRRQALVAGAARSGADLALVALAVLAYQQLGQYSGGGHAPGGAAGGSPSGGLGVDPVLVAAPTLALCAGTLLVLRLLPFVARLGGRLAARGRGLGPALVGWQLARRPGRATGPVLLLVLAVSSGVLALGQHTAWSVSQRDQAAFATAGGLRISGSDVAPAGRGGRYSSLPGGERVLPVVRAEQDLPGGRAGQVLALDAAAVAERVPLRADLRDGRSMRELFAPLAAAGTTPLAPTGGPSAAPTAAPSAASGTAPAVAPPGGGIALPGHPRRIDLDVAVRPAQWAGRTGLGLLLRDRFGLTFRSPMLALPDSGEATVSVDLDALAGAPLGSVATPLSVSGLVFSYGLQEGDARLAGAGAERGAGGFGAEGELAVRRLAVADTPGGASVPVPAGAGPAGWTLSAPPLSGDVPAGEVLPAQEGPGGPSLLRLRYRAGPAAVGGIRLGLLAGAAPPPEVPGIATRAYLRAVGAEVGDLIPVPLGGATVPVRITAAAGSLPVAGDTALAVDLGAAGRLLAADAGRELPAPAEWWLPATSAGDPVPARAAARLRAGAGSQELELREEVAAALLEDPLSAGPQSALAALAVACAVLAAIGFGAAAAAAGRERAGEFAVLLALGTPRGRLRRTAAAESAILVGLGAAVGVGLGAAVVHLVVPLTVLTTSARRPVPEVLVDLPALRVLLLTAAIAAAPLLSAVFAGRRERTGSAAADRLRRLEDM
ncbi:FtsX-like permease family protein [Streptomyces sp. CB00455]|uniref:FtsX-like permease family protein n=1 Tax=Streptomyces sp. CB00455 TaxID=1703927 RepID=UPI00093D3950|nr:FtsX-like permease family protein [Streptomyces sp. CB00455]